MGELTARVERTIQAPVGDVWKALTTPTKMSKLFFGATVDSDFKPGSPIVWKGEWKGKAYEDKGEILNVEPSHELRFSHFSPLTGQADLPENYHVVTFRLNALGKQTKVELSQENLNGDVTVSDAKHRAEYEQNWSKLLDSLEHLFKS